ncbi:MAG: aldo/keto reductase [Pirellulales bacterium]|nr:aldo/keto reductase [Pirellulales bacterium]
MIDRNRREFLKAAAAGLIMSPLAASVLATQEESSGGLPQRALGKTGQKVSILCLGGWHIGSIPEQEAIRLMHQAIDEGINFFDNAWDYHQGGSEEVMGKALSDGGRRDKVFLMTKVCDRDYAGAKKQLEDSLRRLRTDHLDLWQFHEINYPKDPQWVFEKGGIKAAMEARKEGKVRFIGFTGHKDIQFHQEMLNKPFEWDTVQMPINIMDAHFRSFQKEIVPECNRRQIGVIGMKGLAGGHIPKELGLSAEVCRRYALSLPITTLVCGITSRKELEQDLGVARGFKPIGPAELEKLLADTKEEGSQGKHEPFKTSRRFDGGYHRRQHGVT